MATTVGFPDDDADGLSEDALALIQSMVNSAGFARLTETMNEVLRSVVEPIQEQIAASVAPALEQLAKSVTIPSVQFSAASIAALQTLQRAVQAQNAALLVPATLYPPTVEQGVAPVVDDDFMRKAILVSLIALLSGAYVGWKAATVPFDEQVDAYFQLLMSLLLHALGAK